MGEAKADTTGRYVGAPDVLRAGFDALPFAVVILEGPQHCIAAFNEACAPFVDAAALGRPIADAWQLLHQPLNNRVLDTINRVYHGGAAEQNDHVRITPWRQPNDVHGVLLMLGNFAQSAERSAAIAEAATQRDAVRAMQAALLPTDLPILPRVQVAARYLVAAADEDAGGDWFDAVPRANGTVAFVVGDIVGHGVQASAAMGQLRAVLGELLAVEPDLESVLRRANESARVIPGARAATLCVVELNDVTGELRYCTLGHPPPLIRGRDGGTRYLPITGSGPMATESASPVIAHDHLAADEIVFLYSDGLVERPGRLMRDGMTDLARVARDAVAAPDPDAAVEPAAERLCRAAVEELGRGGFADDVTALAAQLRSAALTDFDAAIDGTAAAFADLRDRFEHYLGVLEIEDATTLEIAMSELVANSIEHAHRDGRPGRIEITCHLRRDGVLQLRVADDGTWREPDPAADTSGRGLWIVGELVDRVDVEHSASEPGTRVSVRQPLRHPAAVVTDVAARTAWPATEPTAFGITTTATARPTVTVVGPIDFTTADEFAEQLVLSSRGGVRPLVVDLNGASVLASAGVRALHDVRGLLNAHGNRLALLADEGSPARTLLSLVGLADYVVGGSLP